MFQLITSVGKVEPVFVVHCTHCTKIIGTISPANLHTVNYSLLNINRITYHDIYENPEMWFMIDKANEYLHFSHKSKILQEVLYNDLLNYVTDF